MRTLVHQTVVRLEPLLKAERVEVKCVHWDIHKCLIVPVEIRYWWKTKRQKAAVSTRLIHSLISWTDWPVIGRLMGQCVRVSLWLVETCRSVWHSAVTWGHQTLAPGKDKE